MNTQNTQICERGQILNDNPNPHVQKPRTSMNFLFPDTPDNIDKILAESTYKRIKKCPHCHKEL